MSAAERPAPPVTVVRSARQTDVDDVAGIERTSFSQPWSRAEFSALVRARGVTFLVLTGDGGAVLGYAITYLAGEAADLANIAIAGEARGRGLGRRLLDAVVEDARSRGVTELFLEVRESNRAARSLYERAGFSAVARRRRYYDAPVEDALVLRLPVVPEAGATPRGGGEGAPR
jgi:ribosomal-protein-alanine N-acetyltransferase